MESSRALARCLEQLQINHHGCLRTSRAASSRRLPSRSQHGHHLPSTTRAFSTTLTTKYDGPNPADVTSQSDPSVTSQAQSTGQPQPRRNSLNLSSITSNPNYKAPTPVSPEVRRNTMDALGSLLDRERTRVRNENEGYKTRTTTPNNYETYGRSMFDRPTPNRPPVAGRDFGPLDMRSMVDRFGAAGDVNALTADIKVPELALRLKPTLGRTVEVNDERSFDLTRAFVSLEAKINGRGNSVRKDERNQKYHVRRGQARKIKKRERWRVLFKEGFLGECERVRKMIRQGW
ncbi:hypothetical protein OHC33_001423 [Knufia fluminis]|uniref:Ribosomal protein S21 n=1 Tax=Knufia fluminis TaxID=191047 RepID=A0AAN8EJI6_9EURO|nr:hypothetical protein OHC33_001423 [Knufia fluminis]